MVSKDVSFLASCFCSRACNFVSKYCTKTIIFLEEESVSCVLTLKFIPNVRNWFCNVYRCMQISNSSYERLVLGRQGLSR